MVPNVPSGIISNSYYIFNTVAFKAMYMVGILGHLNLPSSPKLHMICCGLYPQFDEILFNKKLSEDLFLTMS